MCKRVFKLIVLAILFVVMTGGLSGCNKLKTDNTKTERNDEKTKGGEAEQDQGSGERSFYVGYQVFDTAGNIINNRQQLLPQKYVFKMMNLSDDPVSYVLFVTVDGIRQTEVCRGLLEPDGTEPVEVDLATMTGSLNNDGLHLVRASAQFYSEKMAPKHETDFFPSGIVTSFYYAEIDADRCTATYEFDEFTVDDHSITENNDTWFSNEDTGSYKAFLTGERVILHVKCPQGLYSYRIYADGQLIYEGCFEKKEGNTFIKDVTDVVGNSNVVWAEVDSVCDGDISLSGNFFLIKR